MGVRLKSVLELVHPASLLGLHPYRPLKCLGLSPSDPTRVEALLI